MPAILSVIGGILSVVGIIFGIAFSPIGLAIAGVAALVAGFMYLYRHCKLVRDVVGNIWDWLKSIGKWFASFPFGKFFSWIGDGLKKLYSSTPGATPTTTMATPGATLSTPMATPTMAGSILAKHQVTNTVNVVIHDPKGHVDKVTGGKIIKSGSTFNAGYNNSLARSHV